jgi:hypothetical protein
VFVEAFKDERRPLKLALPPGQYRLRRESASGRADAALIELLPGQLLDAAGLSWQEAAARPRGATDAVGEAAIADLEFSAPFTPEVVSTLAAGYQAGREPSTSARRSDTSIEATTFVGTAPLGLAGSELGASLAIARRFGWVYAALRASFATSSHQTDAGPYRLQRWGALLEAGPIWRLGRVDLGLLVGAGTTTTLRRSRSGPAKGHLLGPTAAGGAGLWYALGGGFSLVARARYGVQWLAVDDELRSTGTISGDFGLAWGF